MEGAGASASSTDDLPSSYLKNEGPEAEAVERARNFKRQFAEQYQDRKPLYLIALNECDVEKHICTFLRPSRMPFHEMYYFDGCAEFVASYVTYEPLSKCTEPPKTLRAPMTTLRTQSGNCYEMALALCSCLVGVGYDAYCVVGYAVKGVTTLDESTAVCPMLRDGKEVDELEEFEDDSPVNPYQIRAPKDLTSKFLMMMDKRVEDTEQAGRDKIRQEEEARVAEANKQKPDPYHGLRVHCWVLVLHGKREVASSFYLEPSTGQQVELDTEKYLGIEAIFNHTNYWVNMQDCGSGVQEVVFDLGDSTLWENMFTMESEHSMVVKIPAAGESAIGDEDSDEDGFDEDEYLAGCIELPHSWTEPIKISQLDYDSRCPNGHKTTLYKKAKLEKHGQYKNKKGLITRLIKYQDDLWKNEIEVHEWFRHRSDFLKERITDKTKNEVHDIFGRGHSRSLKDHTYYLAEVGAEARRTVTYFLSGRKDDLAKRDQTPTTMVEYYEDREDFLYKREVEFGVRKKKFGPASEGKYRPIVKIEDFYRRNEAVPAELDVERRRFYMSNDRIVLKFHRSGNNVTRNELSFSKPKDDVSSFALTMDMVDHYKVQANDEKSTLSRLDLHRMYTKMMDAREKLLKAVRESEEEVATTLRQREAEERQLELEISMYDSSRNHEAKKKRVELEQQHQEAIRKRKEKEKDYLSPFLVKLGDPDHLTSEQAATVRLECLAGLQKRMQHQASLMQAKFKLDTKELMRVQKLFQAEEKAGFRTSEADQAYKEQSGALNYRINLVQRRMARHKEESVKKFLKLEDRLDKDTRLAAFRPPNRPRPLE